MALARGLFGGLLAVLFASAPALAQETPEKPQVSPGQETRLEQMKAKGPNASLTILPVRVAGKPFDRVTEVVGLLLEQQGLKDIELGKTAFNPGDKADLERTAVSLGEFIKKNPVATDYALYAEYNGHQGVDELRALVVDESGALVWSDLLTPQDEAWKKMGAKLDLMGCSVLLVQRLMPQLSLNEQTAQAAKPGKMARLMDQRSGLPPEDERTPLPERQQEMKRRLPQATLAVFPARIGGHLVGTGGATNLVKMIVGAGLCEATPAKEALLLKSSQADPNEMKALWDLAREFRDYVRNHPVDADYALYADYVFNSKHWEQGIVHFVVCDRKGEWVIVDMQNSHHSDYQDIRPTSREDCDKLLVKRLEGYLR
jgi:hypothetical protein